MSGPWDRYLSRVQQSMTLRHTAAFPQIGGLVVIGVTAVASYIVLSLWIVPADLPREWHFRSSRGISQVAWLRLLGVRVFRWDNRCRLEPATMMPAAAENTS